MANELPRPDPSIVAQESPQKLRKPPADDCTFHKHADQTKRDDDDNDHKKRNKRLEALKLAVEIALKDEPAQTTLARADAFLTWLKPKKQDD